jgi:multimeric flavodoxin WrbA
MGRTANTAAMVEAVAEELRSAGCEVDTFNTNPHLFRLAATWYNTLG